MAGMTFPPSGRWLAALAAALAVLGGALQWLNHRYLTSRLCAGEAVRCEAGALPLGFELQLALPAQPGHGVHGDTAWARRGCDGAWTWGPGARLDLAPVAFGPLTAAGGCIDLGRTRADAAVSGALLRHGACELELPTLALSWTDAVELRAAARLRPASAEACSFELGERVAALGPGPLSSWQATLYARAGLPYAQAGAMQAAAGSPLLRRLLLSVPMAHQLAVTGPDGRLTLGLRAEPAVEAGQRTARLGLELAAAPALLQHLPEELRAPLRQGPLRLSWELDHGTGVVRLQDRQVARVPATARPAGPVDLAGECPKGRTALLYFVEAGDGGEAVQPRQTQAVLDAVAAARAGGALVSVFVHGWQHSAAPGDSYVCDLATLMRAMADMEAHAARASRRPARSLIGVYVGWPGKLYPVEAANLTTFWNRLEAADRLGADAGVLRALLAGLATQIGPQPRELGPDRRSGLIVTGHSMGGRAVFQALKQALPGGVAPDLVLLVNPAFSAHQFRAVHERARQCLPLPAPQLLFSSEADSVTRQVYPAGQAVTFDGERAPRIPFLEHIYTAANFEEFVTHRLGFELLGGKLPPPDGQQTVLRGFERVPAGSQELLQRDRVTVYNQPAQGRPAPGDAWYRMQVVAEGTGPAAACDTTRVIKVDARVLPDHGTIFTPPFMEFVIRLFNRS